MLTNFFKTCEGCLIFNRPGSELYILYIVLVFLVSIVPFHRIDRLDDDKFRGRIPPIGELPPLSRPRKPLDVDIMVLILTIVSFDLFRVIVQKVLIFIRVVFLMQDRPAFWRSFLRFFNLYYLIVVLPAAFMPPILGQRKPDFHLLAAVILLIFINALGDSISFRYTLNYFDRKLEKLTFEQVFSGDNIAKGFWNSARDESLYYWTVAKGAVVPLFVLISVLAFSSILYGVQIGQFDFELSKDFFRNAWERILQFPSLTSEMYWFKDRAGPFGRSGIPGLFLYGLISFIPIIILGSLALIWLLLMPFRIAVNLPARPWVRVILSESAVFVLCVIISYLLKITLKH